MSDEEKNSEENELTEEEHIFNYLKELVAVDRAMEPFREHAKALKQNYSENKWLTRSQMSMILRAYRAHVTDFDMKDFQDTFDIVKRNINKV